MLNERKRLWYALSLQTGLCRWVVYQIIFLPTLDTSHLFFLQTITSSKHHFLNFFCVSGTHWGLAPSLCSRFPTLHWISSVALPPFATWSMYTHSRCPGHLVISPLTGMLMDVRE